MEIIRRASVAANSLRQYHEFMNLGFPEMIFIFLLALIIFGPKKLPEIGRQVGKILNEFKRASSDFKAQIESEISTLDVTETRRAVVTYSQPPSGTVPSGALAEAETAETASPSESSVATPPELNQVAKAPDA